MNDIYFKHLTDEQEIGYLEGTLSQAEQEKVETHLRLCKYCRMAMEIGKEVLAGVDSDTSEDEPIPQEWIQKALRIAEREWAARRMDVIKSRIARLSSKEIESLPLAAGGTTIPYSGPEFTGEIYKDRAGFLTLDLSTEKEAYIGKSVRVSVLSARRMVGAAENLIEWANGSPDNIVSLYPIDMDKKTEVALAQLSLDDGEDREQLNQIFAEIEIEAI